MSTETLIDRILDRGDETSGSAVDAVHDLMDDATIDATERSLSVAEAAALLGLSSHTLRYYEKQGLVHPLRNPSGYREYAAFDLRRLVFITRMRLSGMTMSDLGRYIALVEQGTGTVTERREIMLDQRDRIAAQMRELALALEITEYKITAYGGHPAG